MLPSSCRHEDRSRVRSLLPQLPASGSHDETCSLFTTLSPVLFPDVPTSSSQPARG